MPSDIWKAFTTEACDPKFARCLFCDALVSRGSADPKKQTTSNLTHHMKKKCNFKDDYEKLLKESKDKTTGNNENHYGLLNL